MGDVVSLVEKAEGAFKEDEAAELAKKMMTGGWVSLVWWVAG
jgi:signal recognition particle GTPase